MESTFYMKYIKIELSKIRESSMDFLESLHFFFCKCFKKKAKKKTRPIDLDKSTSMENHSKETLLFIDI